MIAKDSLTQHDRSLTNGGVKPNTKQLPIRPMETSSAQRRGGQNLSIAAIPGAGRCQVRAARQEEA